MQDPLRRQPSQPGPSTRNPTRKCRAVRHTGTIRRITNTASHADRLLPAETPGRDAGNCCRSIEAEADRGDAIPPVVPGERCVPSSIHENGRCTGTPDLCGRRASTTIAEPDLVHRPESGCLRPYQRALPYRVVLVENDGRARLYPRLALSVLFRPVLLLELPRTPASACGRYARRLPKRQCWSTGAARLAVADSPPQTLAEDVQQMTPARGSLPRSARGTERACPPF